METCADCKYCIDGYCQAKDKGEVSTSVSG